MSIVLTLASAAIIAGVSVSASAVLAIAGNRAASDRMVAEGIDTMFVDSEILVSTLQEYGCCVNAISANEYTVQTQCGNIRYARENAGQAFKMYLNDISNPEALIEQIRSFEIDYGRNVQSYTYNHLKENLSEGMTVVEEQVLEDDSLFLTINIE